MITLAHQRSLLERALTHTENPAIVRLTDRTVEGLALGYLPRTVWRSWVHDGPEDFRTVDDMRSAVHVDWAGRRTLDLTDPGTAHALLVALALTLGLDPGVGGLGVQWTRFMTAWQLEAGDRFYLFLSPTRTGDDELGREAATVAAEPDPLKALVLAALHVLEHP